MKFAVEMAYNKWNAPFLKRVHDCGLCLVQKQAADVLVKQAAAVTEEDLKGNQALIVLERTDGAEIANRALLKHPSVLKYVKQYNVLDFTMHNLPCINGSLLTRQLIQDDRLYTKGVDITFADYNKISLGFNFLHTTVVEPLVNLKMDLLEEDTREVDVFFAGKTYFDDNNGLRLNGRYVTIHRKNCVNFLQKIPGIEAIVFDNKELSRDTYIKVLYNSKVVVSPWGWGEACYRDYEAILAGCILIKPESSYVTSNGNIFNEQFCVWTKPDFSDLQDKVKQAIYIWEDTRTSRYENRCKILESYHDFPHIVNNIFDL